jgi:glutamyl-tRNA synthetase
MEKLLDLNAKYIREEDDAILADLLIPFLTNLGCSDLNRKKVKEAVKTLKARAKTLFEMAQGALFFFKEIDYEKQADEKFLLPEVLDILEDLLLDIKGATSFDQKELENTFSTFLERHQMKLGKVAQPLRVALTGKTVSPGIFEIMEVMGQEMVIKRLSNAISHIKSKRGT